jgi:signal transduction histidine kinase
MTRLWPIARRYALDALIVIAAIAGSLEVILRDDAADAPTSSAWFAAPAIALVVLPLLARRRFPFAAPAMVWLAATAVTFADERLVVFSVSAALAGLVSAFLLGTLRDPVQARIGLLIVLGGGAIIVYNDPGHSTGEFFFTPLQFGIAWLAGFALRERSAAAEAAEDRAAQAEREREAAARIAVAEERARIARELHDVVAHAVSVIVLQVGAVRHKLPEDRAADVDALRGVEETGRAALAEMRHMLGALSRNGENAELEPQPGLADLEALVERVGRAGLAVRLKVEGEPFSIPRGIDLSAYRIVQEGLTNALKHARASNADVTVRYAPDELRIEVRDDGAGASASDGLGHGLVGIRERVKLYGGEMSAGAADGGGFVLATRLPLGGDRR